MSFLSAAFLSAAFRLRRAVFVFGLSLCAFFAAPAFSEESPEDLHKAAMQRLAPLVGEYTAGGVRYTQDGEIPLQENTAKIDYILNGFGLEEKVKVDMGMEEPVTLLTTFSYDPYRQLYRVSVLDDTFGLLDIYEGRFNDKGVLSVTNLRADTYFPFGDDGGRLHFMLQWSLNSPVKTFDVLMTSDGGATWLPYFEMKYTPVQ